MMGIEALGGRVLADRNVSGASIAGDRIDGVVTESGEEYPLDILVWTGRITDLVDMLNVPMTWLSFISTICYNYIVDAAPSIPYQWCYYGQEDVIFNRLTIPVFFSPRAAPTGKCGICAEVTCIEGDEIWDAPETLTSKVEDHLRKTRAIKNVDRIDGLHIERVLDTYPVYKMGYREELNRVKQELGRFTNLRLLGRTGTFWYNNMDHSIKMAIGQVCDIEREARAGE
jgi:protoporphyrinogen oxidase